MILMDREALGCNLGHIVYWVTRIEERKTKNLIFQCRGNIDNNHLRVKFGVKVEQSFGANKSAYWRGSGVDQFPSPPVSHHLIPQG